MRTLLIDNFDSFTYNLRDLAHRVFGAEPVVITNDTDWADIALDDFDGIIVSPGPGRPHRSGDLGISQQAFDQDRLPVLGVCLGHQALSFASGATVDLAPEPMHGRVTSVHHYDSDLFRGVPQGFRAVRYHSLAVTDLPADVEPTAWTPDGVVMAVRHWTRPYWGIQFHPESALTEWGEAMLMNFQTLVHTHPRTPTPDHLALVRHHEHRRRPRVEWQRISAEPNTQRLFENLYSARETSFWLDSSTTDPVSKRLTIMGDATGPLAEVLQYDVTSRQWNVRGNDGERTVNQDFYTYLRAQLHERAVPAVEELPFDFNLGYVGALGYELKDETVGTPAYRSPHPDAALIFADRAIVIDHRECYTYLLTLVDDSQPATRMAAADWLSPTVVDLCTGTGAIALAIATRLPQARVIGADVSDSAVACAQENADRLESVDAGRIEFLQVDIGGENFADHLTGTTDLVTANPPYVPTDLHMPSEWAVYQPKTALYSGADGLDLTRLVTRTAHRLLRPGGTFALEHYDAALDEILTILTDAGFGQITSHRDHDNLPRFILAVKEN